MMWLLLVAAGGGDDDDCDVVPLSEMDVEPFSLKFDVYGVFD